MGRDDPVIHDGDMKEREALKTKKQAKPPYKYPWRPHYYVSVITATLLYFVPCGMIGLILLIQAQILKASGHDEPAERKREQAKCCTGSAIGFVFVLLIVIVIIMFNPKSKVIGG